MTRGARSFNASALLYHISEGSTERTTSRNVKLRLKQSNSLGFHSLAGRNKGRKRIWVERDPQRPKPSDPLASVLPSPGRRASWDPRRRPQQGRGPSETP